jgi:predicted ArsR family transcriptional regulator
MNATHVTPRMLDALEAVKRLEPCTAQQLAVELGVQMASARTYLSNLRVIGFVRPSACNRWARWSTCRVQAENPEIVQCSSVWEYAARCRHSQESRA